MMYALWFPPQVIPRHLAIAPTDGQPLTREQQLLADFCLSQRAAIDRLNPQPKADIGISLPR